MQRKDKRNRKRRSRLGPVIAALALIVIAAGVLLAQRYIPSRERMAPEAYFGTLAENEAAVVLQDHLLESRALYQDGALYLDYGLVRDELNSRFFWDEGNDQMLFTTALETYEIPVNSAEYRIDGTTQQYDRPIVLNTENGLYVCADFLQLYTNVEYTPAGEGPSRHVLIRDQWGLQKTATLRRDTAVRYLGGIKSEILTDALKGDTVQVLEELENWSRVVTPDGYIGYVPKRRLTETQESEIVREFEEPQYPSLTRDEKIRMVWHQIDYEEANDHLSEDIAAMKGINVISPTWFSVADNEGAIHSMADEEYVKTAHEAGLEVWGLISNFSPDVDTTVLLSSTAARRRMVDTLIQEALRLGMEGINLDFEYIREESSFSYVQFARELSIGCRKNGLVFSIDVPVPMDFNRYFNRRELGTVADYLIVMGYDEHYYGSESAGSVASLGFEENGITGTLEEDVPAGKIISGIPFYTRIWYTVDNGDGTANVTSEVLGMDAVERTLESYSVTPVWDEGTAQEYASWTVEDGTLCEIWIENEKSLAQKAQLINRYELGGFAAWMLRDARDTVWDVLAETVTG